MALNHGVTSAPWWIAFLDMAKDWGTPPWELFPGESPVIWMMRYSVYRDERIKASNGR